MTKAPFDYRFRYIIHGLLYFGGFAFYWLPSARESTWLVLTPWLERTHLFTFTSATVALLVVATLLALLGGLLRTWGSAYLGAGIVESRDMHGSRVLADGPFRYLRNPLYLGTFLHTIGLSLIMSPWGSVFTIVTVGLFQLRLIFVEEPFLRAKLGEAYEEYSCRVPRFVPSVTPSVPASGTPPRWLQAVISESYMLGVALCFATFGWRYNAYLLTKCVVFCFGVSLVLRAAMPPAKQETAAI